MAAPRELGCLHWATWWAMCENAPATWQVEFVKRLRAKMDAGLPWETAELVVYGAMNGSQWVVPTAPKTTGESK